MKILLLSPYSPYPPYGGGAMRIYYLLRELAARHEITCLTFVPDAAAEQALEPLRSICRVLTIRGPSRRSKLRRAWTTLSAPLPDMALRNASRAYAETLQRLLSSERFDVVQAESIEMAEFGMLASRQSSARRPRLVLDEFNAEYILQKRAALTDLRHPRRLPGAIYSLIQWRKLAAYERRLLSSYDQLLAVSAEDRRALHALAPQAQIGIVPNGVDTSHFSRAAIRSERAGPLSLHQPTLVFSGTLDFRPNIDAVIWFTQQVLPRIRAQRPDARLLVVGRRPAPALQALANEGALTLTGEVPDARPFISGAAAYIVPMRIGGGIRLKLLEALALEAPIVSTHMGAEGVVDLQSGQHCLLASRPEAFAAAVLQLLDSPALGQQLGQAGRALVQRTYDWSTIVPQLDRLYDHTPDRTVSVEG